jgi:hypothetical protein
MTKLKPEEPATGILKLKEFDFHTSYSVLYKISCDCGIDDHVVDMEIEADDQCISVNLYTTATTNYWTNYWHDSDWKSPWLYQIYRVLGGFVNSLSRKISITYDIWFKGYTEYQSSHILTEQQALNVAHILQNGIKDCNKRIKKHTNK